MKSIAYLEKRLKEIGSLSNNCKITPLAAMEEIDKALEESIRRQHQEFKSFYTIGVMNGMVSNKMDIELDIDKLFDELYEKYTL